LQSKTFWMKRDVFGGGQPAGLAAAKKESL
jgi:hypothetical protein